MKYTPGQKLRPAEVRGYRMSMLARQRSICPLCKQKILPHEAALDHDHATGRIRGVLHRQCNSVEGRVLHWTRRTGRTTPDEFLRNVLRYWNKDYTRNPEHPNHGKPRPKRRRSQRKRKR